MVVAVAATTCAAASAAEAPTVDIEAAGANKITIDGDWLTAGAGAVWVTDGQRGVVSRLNPTTGQIDARISISSPCEASDFGLDAVWTATCGPYGLARLNPATNKVSAFLKMNVTRMWRGEASIGVGTNAVWVVLDTAKCIACRLARVVSRPRSLRIVKRIAIRSGGAGVRFGEGAVWVTNPALGLVQKIDVARNRVVATTKVGPTPRFFAVGEGDVWTLNQNDGSVTRLDPASGAVAATIAAGVVGSGGDMTAGGGWIWARGTDILLTQIDPRTNTVVRRYGPPSGSGAAVVGFGAVWVSAHDISTIWRLPLPSP
jgi:virginiamycin B lyase